MPMDGKKSGRFFIRTFGCKVNQYETQAMRELLLRAGYEEAVREAADVCILNTCTVTEEADKEARYYVNLIRRTNPRARLVLAGCLVNAGAPTIDLTGVSCLVRNEEKVRIVEILQGTAQAPVRHTPLPDVWASVSTFAGRTKAFVKIQDGCENFCTYCKVPYVRGSFRSRPLASIVDEVCRLADAGFREIVLTGICLGAWGQDRWQREIARGVGMEGAGILDVLRALEAVPGDVRIRLSSIELKHVTDELLMYIAGHPRICRHLHIPLQSGADQILKRMNRPYTTAAFKEVVDRARRAIPGAALTTDCMVGFPGESDAHANATAAFLKEITPLRTHLFTYSRRPGTAAARLDGAVDPRQAKERRARLESVALDLSLMARISLADAPAQVLVETQRDRATGLLCGYSDNYMKIRFEGPDALMGRIVPVAITDVALRSTTGAYAGQDPL